MKFSLLKTNLRGGNVRTVQMGDILISGAAVSGAVVLGLLFGGSLEKPREMVVYIFGQKVKVGRDVWCGACGLGGDGDGTKNGRRRGGGLPGVGDEQVNVSPSTAVCSVDSEDRRDLSIVNDPMKSRVGGANCRCWCRVSVPR